MKNKIRIFISILLTLCIALISISCAREVETPNLSNEKLENNQLDILNFSAEDLKTGEILGKEILENINIITIWQIECPPCKIEAEGIEDIYKNYPDINFMGICFADDSDEVLKTMEEWGISYKNYKMTNDFAKSLEDKVTRTPTMFFVDKEGKELISMEEGLEFPEATPEDVSEFLEEVIKGLENK